MLDPVIGS